MFEGKLSTEGGDRWIWEGVHPPPTPSFWWAAIMADMSLTCPLSTMTAKSGPSALCLPHNKPQVTFPAGVPSHPGKKNEHFRNVHERKDRTRKICMGWSQSHKADARIDMFSYSLKY
ncbi:hypothetical protein E3U43_017910 [Larimichthys crocea]|uniref:Uncharacterized protein n=1 Tax=Larimichthys crocea TaxID=215358 RepID=A0ACD3R0A5_LARCR|nr:hypothetical protein E3U43_017910 [Larimichthys crocea]